MPSPKLLATAVAGLALAGTVTWIALRPENGHAGRAVVRASVFVATGGSDAGPCTRRRPCASFDRAYRKAKAGEVVDVAPGHYPKQELRGDPRKRRKKPVLFRAATGARVTLENLTVEGASYVKFRGFRITEAIRVLNLGGEALGSRHVVFERLRAQTIKIVGQVANITVRGGTFGDTVDWQPQIGKANLSDPDSSRPHNILIDGATFQNYRRSGSAVHTECLQVLHVNGLIVRNSRFNHCDGTGDIGITDGPSDNLLFENNFLGKAGDAYYSMQITKNVRNLILRNNSASKAAVFSDTKTGGPYTITGNYMPYSSGLCTPGGTYSHNVFAGGTCGPTDTNAPAMRFVNADAFDLHLAPDSEAVDRGDPTSHPTHDIDGTTRPQGPAPDAGAHELR